MLSKVYIKVSEFVSNPIVTVNNVPYVYGSEYTSGSLITIKIIATNYQDYVKTLVVPENNILIKINPIDLSSYATKNYLSNQLEGYVTLATDQTIASNKTFTKSKYADIPIMFKDYDNLDSVTGEDEKYLNAEVSYYDSNNKFISDLLFYNNKYPNYAIKGAQLRVANDEKNAVEFIGLRKYVKGSTIEYQLDASSAIKTSIAHLSFPGETLLELTVPANGVATNYTITRDGYFTLSIIRSSGSGTVFCNIVSSNLTNSSHSTSNLEMIMPVRKGTTVNVVWGTGGSWVGTFAFLREVVAVAG